MPSAAAYFVLASQPVPTAPFAITMPRAPRAAVSVRAAAVVAAIRSVGHAGRMQPDPEIAIGRATGARV